MTKLVLMFLFTAASAGLFATDVPIHISATNKWIVIEKVPWKAPKLDVLIRQADGHVIMWESIKKTTKFNLKYVPDGDYVLELENNQKRIIHHMSVQNGMLNKHAVSTTYKPQIKITNDYLDLNLMTQGLPAKVIIRHSSGKIAHTENIVNEVSATRRFNIKALESGEYLFDVYMNDQVFTTQIDKI